jgi:hypothetical protein
MHTHVVIWPIIILAISTIVFVKSKIGIIDHFTCYNGTYPKYTKDLHIQHRKLWWLKKIMITSIIITILSFIVSSYEILILFLQLP